MANLTGLAERLPELRSSEPERPPRYTIQTVPRPARERPKGRVVAARQFEALKLIGEEVAEFEDRPVACKATYRVVVLGKELVVETGPLGLFEPDRFYFYLTNDRTTPASEIVFLAMASLAWGLKAWAALLLPEHPRWAERPRAEERSLRRMESSTSCGALIPVPCQIVRAAGRIVYRLLSWNPWRGAFLRLVERLHGLRLC